jgi:hypothetical protein
MRKRNRRPLPAEKSTQSRSSQSMAFKLAGRSAEEAKIVGTELLKMVEFHKVEGVRSLDPEAVLKEVHENPRHPLRFLYGDFKDVDGAAWAHWVTTTRQILTGLRYVRVSVNMPTSCGQPVFVAAKAPTLRGQDIVYRNQRVLRKDALKHDPSYSSLLSRTVKQIRDALVSLEQIVSDRQAPEKETILARELREAFENYYA